MAPRIRSAPATVALLSALAVSLFAGCSGDSELAANSENPPPVEKKSEKRSDFEPRQLRKKTIAKLVRNYYSNLDAGEYRDAWRRLDAGVREDFNGYDAWVAGFATTVSQTPKRVRVIQSNANHATVRLRLSAVDENVCGDRYRQRFTGSWNLIRINGLWRAEGIQMQRVSGSGPSPNEKCEEQPPEKEPDPEPNPGTGCHPSYDGVCLDPNSYDYDCVGGSGDGPDYTGPVQVIGPDQFGLDRDGDGFACE